MEPQGLASLHELSCLGVAGPGANELTLVLAELSGPAQAMPAFLSFLGPEGWRIEMLQLYGAYCRAGFFICTRQDESGVLVQYVLLREADTVRSELRFKVKGYPATELFFEPVELVCRISSINVEALGE